MTNILICVPMEDKQSGTYIHDSLIQMNHRVAYFDWRFIAQESGEEEMNKIFLKAVEQLKPDVTIIIKGLGITGESVKKAKELHDHPIVGWIFDVTLGGTLITDVPPYINFIKALDIFYTIDNDSVDKLKALGVNAKWLSEGCFKPSHKEQVLNYMQQKKYGADVVFLGSVGTIHPNREKLLSRIHKEGFDFKIYGDVFYKNGKEPLWVKDNHTGFAAFNDYHSMVCNSSKIIIGIDGWPERDKAYSARLYRTLCAGGFLLTTHTKGMEEEFVPGEHLDTFKNEDEMIKKILKYLNDDELREKIAKNGQKLVLKQHNFVDRLKVILEQAKDLYTSNDIIYIK